MKGFRTTQTKNAFYVHKDILANSGYKAQESIMISEETTKQTGNKQTGTCQHCLNLLMYKHTHPNLTQVSEISGSALYKCDSCQSYLHNHDGIWELISGGS